MNQTEEQETDETCNVCGKENVTASWGRYKCQTRGCLAHDIDNNLGPFSSDEQIEEYYKELNDSETSGTGQRLNKDY